MTKVSFFLADNSDVQEIMEFEDDERAFEAAEAMLDRGDYDRYEIVEA